MKTATVVDCQLGEIPQVVRTAEADGYDAVFASEIADDPFLRCLLAAEHSEHVTVGTGIAVAFARSPMVTAYSAHQLQAYSGGRFVLGLGTQVQAHIERRFAMPWSRPAARMREYVVALRAIWESWQNESRLNFRGDFYQHTLMTPFFAPNRVESGPAKVFIAGVGPKMTTVAAEVADGFICHAFTTERYLRERTLPALEAGRGASSVPRDQFEVSMHVLVATGTNEESMAAAVAGTRQQLAFYASTPAYRPVLDLHGWTDLQGELNEMSREGRWADMAGLIDDDVLRTFAIVDEPDQVAAGLLDRFGDLVTSLSLYTPYRADPAMIRSIVQALQSA